MFRQCFLLYFIVVTIPFFLGYTAWHSVRYTNLEIETKKLEADQKELVENNRRLIAEIAELTSSEKVENIAINNLRLVKIRPENVLQIWIDKK